jgi:hypothetical protein
MDLMYITSNDVIFYIHYFTTSFQLFGKYPTGGKNFAKDSTSCFFERYSILIYKLYERSIFSSSFGFLDHSNSILLIKLTTSRIKWLISIGVTIFLVDCTVCIKSYCICTSVCKLWIPR